MTNKHTRKDIVMVEGPALQQQNGYLTEITNPD